MSAGSNAKQYNTDQIHYLRKTVSFEDGTVVVGKIPAEAIILKALSGVHVVTAFNDTGADLIDVGYAAYTNSAGSSVNADPDAFATDIDVSSAGYAALDETAADFYANSDQAGVEITATYAGASGDASAGSAEVIISYTVTQPGKASS